MNELLLAIQNQDLETIKNLIAQDISLLYYTNEYLRTPLHTASYVGNIGIINFLLDSGANINTTDESNDNPLCIAIQTGNLKIIELLISKGADVALTSESIVSPVHYSVYHNNKELLDLLTKAHDFNINQDVYEYGTPLHTACETGNLNFVKQLIKLGAKIDDDSLFGDTPLCVATLHGFELIVEELLKQGADPNHCFINTPLSIAKQKGFKNIVTLLKTYSAHENPPPTSSFANEYDDVPF